MDRTRSFATETATADVPLGYCGCGCAAKTPPAKTSDSRPGRVKGQPLRYLLGHNRRRRVRYLRFWAGHIGDCWIWVRARYPNGYGRVADGSGGCTYAHRVYYEQANGPIPSGLQIDHLCCIPQCVNPEHLEAVTPATNVRRGRNAKLTEEQVAEIRGSDLKQVELARRYGVSQSQVSRIKKGRSWRPS
jgi:HNH endonuclease